MAAAPLPRNLRIANGMGLCHRACDLGDLKYNFGPFLAQNAPKHLRLCRIRPKSIFSQRVQRGSGGKQIRKLPEGEQGSADSRQKLCGNPQAGGAAGSNATTRPSGQRNAGQPKQVESQIGEQGAVGGDPADGLQQVQGPGEKSEPLSVRSTPPASPHKREACCPTAWLLQ
jgi:hypothetical protein